MADEWTHLLTFPWKSVRLGTLVRVGVALGWDIDDLTVVRHYDAQELWRRSGAVAERPPVMVLAGQEALDEWASRPWEVFGQRTAEPMPEPEQPDEPPPDDGDAAPLDTPLAAFDEAMAAKADPASVADAPSDPPATVMVGEHEVPYDDLPLTRYCRQCGREFVSKKAARFHEDNHHGDPMALTCDDCGWVFTTRSGLNHHATMKHGDGGAKPIPHVYRPHR